MIMEKFSTHSGNCRELYEEEEGDYCLTDLFHNRLTESRKEAQGGQKHMKGKELNNTNKIVFNIFGLLSIYRNISTLINFIHTCMQ